MLVRIPAHPPRGRCGLGSHCCPAPVSGAAVPAPPATDAEASALLDSIGENLLRLSPESATSLGVDTGERAALRSQLGRPLGRRPTAPCRDDSSGPRARQSDRHQRICPSRCGPASRSCAAPTRPRSRASPCPMATLRSAAGATRHMSSSRMSAPISTFRASSTPSIRSRPRPTPKPISPACSLSQAARRRARTRMRRRARRPGPARTS